MNHQITPDDMDTPTGRSLVSNIPASGPANVEVYRALGIDPDLVAAGPLEIHVYGRNAVLVTWKGARSVTLEELANALDAAERTTRPAKRPAKEQA